MRRTLMVSLACLLGASAVVHAQPANTGDKGDAKALLQSGLKLFAAKDYLGALSVFETAYARFPSSKILLNIGTTLLKLDRRADAANAYQRYLDAKDGDPAKVTEVTKVLGELDRGLGVLEVSVEPSREAEIQIGEKKWTRLGDLAKYRLDAGATTVRARRTGYLPSEEIVQLEGGTSRKVALVLEAEPVAAVSATVTEAGVRATVEPRSRSRLGVLALAHIDPTNKGAAVLVGLTADVMSRLQVQGAALLGPASGLYLGATFALMTGTVRPILAAGVPVFISDGARVALRGAGGVELAISRHFAVIAQVGVEYIVNPGPGISSTLFIPAIGATARL